jgi:hypothetical protein
VRSAILFLALTAQMHVGGLRVPRPVESPRVAATAPNPDYPLKVRVLGSARTHDKFGTHSYGVGNLLGGKPVGFDYTSDCEGGFLHNVQEGEFYQGKWKKQDRKVEILVQDPGNTHVEKCDVNVTLKAEPYGKDNPPPAL